MTTVSPEKPSNQNDIHSAGFNIFGGLLKWARNTCTGYVLTPVLETDRNSVSVSITAVSVSAETENVVSVAVSVTAP